MTNFIADYSYGKDGILSRTRIQGSPQIHLNGARSDFAVQSYLHRLHPGAEILIYSISWR